MGGKIDPFSQELPLGDNPGLLPREYVTFPPDKCFITLPIFKSQEPAEREVVAWKRLELEEGRIYHLQGRHIGLVVGGPAGSGKSTLAATLADEMMNIIHSLKSRASFSDLEVSLECANLDLATPTVDAIGGARGKEKQALDKAKRPWTLELALEALDKFWAAKSRANLVIADLPGGKIDQITEITGALGDVGVLITKDWAKMAEWQQLYTRMGITLVSQSRSRLPDEGLESVVTRYNAGGMIAGRVTGLDRTVRSWDSFAACLAKVLLFDLIPGFIESHQGKLDVLKAGCLVQPNIQR